MSILFIQIVDFPLKLSSALDRTLKSMWIDWVSYRCDPEEEEYALIHAWDYISISNLYDLHRIGNLHPITYYINWEVPPIRVNFSTLRSKSCLKYLKRVWKRICQEFYSKRAVKSKREIMGAFLYNSWKITLKMSVVRPSFENLSIDSVNRYNRNCRNKWKDRKIIQALSPSLTLCRK